MFFDAHLILGDCIGWMEKDFGSWFLCQHSNGKLPNLNTLNAPLNPGQPNAISNCMSPCANAVSANGTLPGFLFSGVPHVKASQPNNPHDWFNCSPRFSQAFTSVPHSIFKRKIPAGPSDNHEELITPNPASWCARKRFLVFDQSGDQTTLILSSAVGTPVQCLTYCGSKLNGAYDLTKQVIGTGGDSIHIPGPISTDECNENNRNDVESDDMHEDTDELNALLYSDDDYYSEDDEEASTGHSPSTMTAYDKQKEVASSVGPNKRIKLSDGGYNVPSLMDTASSVTPKRCFDYEADAESSCADGKNEEVGLLSSGNKTSRKDNIRETVSVLQNIIPGGRGKDTVVVLDEAINYLRSLKHKAQALGIDTI